MRQPGPHPCQMQDDGEVVRQFGEVTGPEVDRDRADTSRLELVPGRQPAPVWCRLLVECLAIALARVDESCCSPDLVVAGKVARERAGDGAGHAGHEDLLAGDHSTTFF